MSNVDSLGRFIADPKDIFELFYLDADPKDLVCEHDADVAEYNRQCVIWNKLDQKIEEICISTSDNNIQRISEWSVPDEYADMNIRNFLLKKCKSDIEKNRVNHEMDLFEERNMLVLLRLMICLIEHFRNNSVVWGVGRGSSVSSFCLFLIGVHKINPITYGLDVEDFLR